MAHVQPHPDSNTHTHGISYPPHFISSLPTLTSPHSQNTSQVPHTPIRRLSAPQFADIHLKYITSHAPDHVLFPFLHGLEGDNEAQNQFFASAGTVCLPPTSDNRDRSTSSTFVPQVPNYRGLVWVATDDQFSQFSFHAQSYDSDSHASYMDAYPDSEPDDAYSTSSISTTSDDDDFDDPGVAAVDAAAMANSGADSHRYVGMGQVPMDLDMEMEMEMDVDVSAVPGENGIHPVRGNEEKHMHPVKERTKAPVQSASIPISPASTAPSLSCSTTTTESYHSACNSASNFSPIPLSTSPPPFVRTPPVYPHLTSSFRSRELVRESIDLNASNYGGVGAVERFGYGMQGGTNGAGRSPPDSGSGDWEFVDPKVPDGISLRNFGIQAPIYATISDIVVYSPQGNVHSAILLAQRCKQAVEKKYLTRLQRLRTVHPGASPTEDFGLVKYNVFVLDATPDEIHTHMPHLVSRLEDMSVPHSHTDGTDAHAHGDLPEPNSPPSIYDGSAAPSPSGSGLAVSTPGYDQAEKGLFSQNGNGKPKKMKTLPANTISFAQREKDEMRDLTRASEILTFFPPSTAPAGTATATTSHTTSDSRDGDSSKWNENTGDNKERERVSGSSTSTFWDPTLGQIFLGNSNDVPLPTDSPVYTRRFVRNSHSPHCRHSTDGSSSFSGSADFCSCCDDEEWDWSGNDPVQGFGYDICIECDDLAPFPNLAQMKKAEEHIRSMEKAWVDRCLRRYEQEPRPTGFNDDGDDGEMVDVMQLPPRPPPNPNAVIHLPFPSSVSYTTSLLPFLSWVETLVRPQPPVEVHIQSRRQSSLAQDATPKGKGVGRRGSSAGMTSGSVGFMPSSLPPPSAFPSSFLPTNDTSGPSSSAYQRVRSTSATHLHSGPGVHNLAASSPSSFSSLRQQAQRTPTPPSAPTVMSQQPLTRPLKVLIYSADGYTESSSLALCLLMAFKGLNLPEAYLELQVEKRRSFFVYGGEVSALKRIEARLEKERHLNVNASILCANGGGHPRNGHHGTTSRRVSFASPPTTSPMSFLGPSPSSTSTKTPSETQTTTTSPPPPKANNGAPLGSPPRHQRPRASTMPLMPALQDHQVWFNDPRFDGSFPSRVLPFLYLGNLNHASNVYMLHALGITHVVSVGECALVPLANHHYASPPPTPTDCPIFNNPFSPSRSPIPPVQHGSLWLEEREGRIKVLDIKGICDDGIDTLEPQLGPICDWIDRARQEGGKVLVHCRVGVSRSATVTIAYVMQYLGVPLVDAYLVVRSRRLSVLIQPNMRLLYNLIGWELKLAMDRCKKGEAEEGGGEKRDEERLKMELSRCLNWPYLAKEVHALNEKYLR